jgi:hypothetical protein
MAKQRRDTGLWSFLEHSGVLENGDADQIAAAKKLYRKAYLKAYKQKQRKEKPEFLVQFSEKEHYSRVAKAAKKHHLSISAFLKNATLAYLDRSYLIPDRIVVGKLALLLEGCLNDVRAISTTKTKHTSFVLEEKYEAIERRIGVLQDHIRDLFCYPALLENAVAEAARNPHTCQRLNIILSNAHRENQDIQETQV